VSAQPPHDESEFYGPIDDDARERHGWDAAVTLVTPIERRRPVRWKRKLILGALDRTSLIDAGHDLGVVPFEPLEDQFKRFNHLHYARWSLVDRLPRTSRGQPPETGPYTLLIFTSHFDFGWRRYLGTFIEGLGNGLQHLWGDEPSWRLPSDGFSQFEKFVENQIVDHAHLFAAYPNWSCNDVRCALRIQYECESAGLSDGVVRDLGFDVDDEASRRGLVRRLQHCLGRIPPIDDMYEGVHAADLPERPRPAHGVTYLVPLPHDQVALVTSVLRNLPYGPSSPFARVPGTHFARIALINKEYFDRHRHPRVDLFESAYLLLTAEIDADAEPWLRTLFADEAMGEVISRCWGFAPDSDVVSFLRPCRIRKAVEYIDYPTTTVADIFAASKGLDAHYRELGL
jgi:hypothetical protein